MKKKESWNTENRYKPWSDAELSVILSDAPTKANREKYARAFKRGSGSIEQIYRWAMTSKKDIKKKRGDEKFVNQVKRVSKKLGWVA